MFRRSNVAELAAEVVLNDSCSGCGACPLIEPALEMQMSETGFMRPVSVRPSSGSQRTKVREFERVCPGRQIRINVDPEARLSNSALGKAVSVWKGYAADPAVRYAGSSGGVLTALQQWLLESSSSTSVLTTRADPVRHRRTAPYVEVSSPDLTKSAGSRYAPSATLELLACTKPGETTVTAKPCEAAAARALVKEGRIDEPPLILSFFCAGVPSQAATDEILEVLGFESSRPVTSLRYRGHGWPGEFTATDSDGVTVADTYDRSWGQFLGPAVQSRCKVCPDGVGRAADVVAADFWEADESGYPAFDEQDGLSAVVARTRRGHDALMQAWRDGAIVLEPTDLASLAAVQPLQVDRNNTLGGRRLGRFASRLSNIRVRGIAYRRHSVLHPLRALRYAVGSWRRTRRR